MSEILDVVNDRDEVVGQAERDEVYGQGLIYRSVYVCFYTLEKQIILQRRSLTKKNNPGKLTTTVSGHVGSGMTYLDAAIKETQEETGIAIDGAKLRRLGVIYADETHGDYKNKAMRALYIYQYQGGIDQLAVEPGEGSGFEVFTIKQLRQSLVETPGEFVPFLVDQANDGLLDTIEAEA